MGISGKALRALDLSFAKQAAERDLGLSATVTTEKNATKMGIFVKTKMTTMPDSCIECEYGRRYGCVGDVECTVLHEYFTNNVEPPYKERPDKCPLVEAEIAPPDTHGGRTTARKYFVDKLGLTYADVSVKDIMDLRTLLNERFGAMEKPFSELRFEVNNIREDPNSGIAYAFITLCRPEHMVNKQGIYFNPNESITFVEWARPEILEPVLQVFYTWCDTLASRMGLPARETSTTTAESTDAEKIKKILNRDAARFHFVKNGLSYADLTMDRLQDLVESVRAAFNAAYQAGQVRYPLRIGIDLVNRPAGSKHICAAFLNVTSPEPVMGRDGIAFLRDGSINFAGWADDDTLTVFLQAFCAWCDTVAQEKAEEG